MRKSRRVPVATDKRFKKSLPDYGTKERWGHSNRIFEILKDTDSFVARAIGATILDECFEKGLIDKKECDAGIRFKSDYFDAGLQNRIKANDDNPFNPFAPDRSKQQEEVYARWQKTLHAVSPRHRNILISVVQEIPTQFSESLKAALGELVAIYRL